jgi:hypothetical protein
MEALCAYQWLKPLLTNSLRRVRRTFRADEHAASRKILTSHDESARGPKCGGMEGGKEETR